MYVFDCRVWGVAGGSYILGRVRGCFGTVLTADVKLYVGKLRDR